MEQCSEILLDIRAELSIIRSFLFHIENFSSIILLNPTVHSPRFPFRILHIFTFLALAFAVSSVVSAEGQSISEAMPMDQLHPELHAHLVAAEANSWAMQLSDIRLKQEEARSRVTRSRDNFKANMNLSVGIVDSRTERNGKKNKTGSNMQYRYTLSGSKPLFHFGALSARKKGAKLQVERAGLGGELAFLNTYRQVVNGYLDYQVAAQKLKQKQLALEVLQLEFDIHEDQVTRGEYAKSLLDVDSLALKRTRLQVDGLVVALDKVFNSYVSIIGIDPSVNIEFGRGIPDVPESLSALELKTQGFLSNFENQSNKYLSQLMGVEIESENFVQVKATNKPKVSGFVRLRRDTEETGVAGGQYDLTEFFGGISVRWAAWDGGYSKGSKLNSLQVKRQLKSELNRISVTVEKDLNFLLEELRIRKEECHLINTEMRWKENQIVVTRKEVDEGRAPEVAMKVIENQLEALKIRQYQTRASFYKTLTNFYVTMEDSSIYAYVQ